MRGYIGGPSAAAAVLTLALALGSSAPGAAASEEPVSPRAVAAAITKGIAWLRDRQDDKGGFPLDPPTAGSDPSASWNGGPWAKGVDALATYTLLECAGPAAGDHEVTAKRALQRLSQHWEHRVVPDSVDRMSEPPQDGTSTYFVSLCLLALDAYYNRDAAATEEKGPGVVSVRMSKKDRVWAQEMLLWLRCAQDPGAKNDRRLPPASSSEKLIAYRASRGKATYRQGGAFDYSLPVEYDGCLDLSNTQFAVLGLKAASRLGLEVPASVWSRAARAYISSQERTGPQADSSAAVSELPSLGFKSKGRLPRSRGWPYHVPGSRMDSRNRSTVCKGAARPSMTAGGVASLVLCHTELLGKREYSRYLRTEVQRGVLDGLARLSLLYSSYPDLEEGGASRSFEGRARALGTSLSDFFFLCALKRACVLCKLANLGGVNWYQVGANRIVESQLPSGNFRGGSRDNGNGRELIDTCFALLFLNGSVVGATKAVVTEAAK